MKYEKPEVTVSRAVINAVRGHVGVKRLVPCWDNPFPEGASGYEDWE
jgi:hypothetical protein